MGDGIYVALSGAVSAENALATTATNLANANTAGYSRMQPVFHEQLNRARSLHFQNVTRTALDTTRGEAKSTSRPLDVALPEGGYLAVRTPQGQERFTRAGALKVGEGGLLRTNHGDLVLNEGGNPIDIGPGESSISITPLGEVRRGSASIGKLKVVEFDDPSALTLEGGHLLAQSGSTGAPRPCTQTIEVGALEGSNVNIATAMTDIVRATRTFDAFERTIAAFHDADRKASSIAGGG